MTKCPHSSWEWLWAQSHAHVFTSSWFDVKFSNSCGESDTNWNRRKRRLILQNKNGETREELGWGVSKRRKFTNELGNHLTSGPITSQWVWHKHSENKHTDKTMGLAMLSKIPSLSPARKTFQPPVFDWQARGHSSRVYRRTSFTPWVFIWKPPVYLRLKKTFTANLRVKEKKHGLLLTSSTNQTPASPV